MININVNNGLRSVAAPEPSTSVSQPKVVEGVRPEETNSTEVNTAERLPQEAPNSKELATAVSKLNDFVQNIQRTLSFSVEEDTGITVVKVFDSETEELIRQIPAEETIKLAASIEGQIASLFLQEQA